MNVLSQIRVEFAQTGEERAVSVACVGGRMEVELVNDGPVTILLDSREA